MRIRQALDTVVYNETLKCYQISAKYWPDLEPDTYNLYSNYSILKTELIKTILNQFN